MHPLPAGSLYGPFAIVGLLGHGNTGPVYLAKRGDETLALKVLTNTDTSVGAYFRNEITLLRRATNDADGCVHLQRYCTSQTTAGQEIFLATEYIPGYDLSEVVGQPVETAFVARVASELAQALDYLHTRHVNAPVVHRDVKPSNIRVTNTGGLVLLDLSAAKHADFGQLDERGFLTPSYASPEAHEARETPASDQFSLALVLYELLTGQPALPRRSSAARRQITRWVEAGRTTLPPARGLVPDVAAVLARGASINPADRYPSCGEFAAAFNAALGPEGFAAGQVEAPAPRRSRVPLPSFQPVLLLAALLFVAQLVVASIGGTLAGRPTAAIAAALPADGAAAAAAETVPVSPTVAAAPAGADAMRAATGGCALRSGPAFTNTWLPYQGGNVPPELPLVLLAQEGQWYHVQLPDGSSGWCPVTQMRQS